MSETTAPATFLDECLRGYAMLTDVDDWVDRWHDAGGAPYGAPIALRDFLGLGRQEYAMWVEQPGSIRFAAAARHAGRPVDDVREVVRTAVAAARAGDDAEARQLIQWLRDTGRLTDDDLSS